MFRLPTLLVLAFVQFIFVIFSSLTLIQLATVGFLCAYFRPLRSDCFCFRWHSQWNFKIQVRLPMITFHARCRCFFSFLFSCGNLHKKWKTFIIMSEEFYSCSHEANIFRICWLILCCEAARLEIFNTMWLSFSGSCGEVNKIRSELCEWESQSYFFCCYRLWFCYPSFFAFLFHGELLNCQVALGNDVFEEIFLILFNLSLLNKWTVNVEFYGSR